MPKFLMVCHTIFTECIYTITQQGVCIKRVAVKQNEIVKFLFVVTVSNLLGSLFSTKGNSNLCLLLKKRSELFRCVTVNSDDFLENLIVNPLTPKSD